MGGRKALNDITNKKSIQPEASSRKKNFPKEDINIKEEMFSHNHTKCIEAQKAAMCSFNLDAVLPPDGKTNYLAFSSIFGALMIYVVMCFSEV
jgi:hypothetical protein